MELNLENLKEGFYFAWTDSFIMIKEIKSEDSILMYHWQYPALSIEYVDLDIVDGYLSRGVNGKKYNIPLDKKDKKSRLKMIKSIFNAIIYHHKNG